MVLFVVVVLPMNVTMVALAAKEPVGVAGPLVQYFVNADIDDKVCCSCDDHD